MTSTPRPRLSVALHLHHDPQPTWFIADIEPEPIARLDILDGLAIQASDPAFLRSLAAAFDGAADDLEAAGEAQVAVTAAPEPTSGVTV